MSRNYWLDLFTGRTWDEFLKAGGNVSGFRESRWNTVQKIRKGDYLLCYVTGISRFIGILEVTSEAYFQEEKNIWKGEYFPCRLGVEVKVALDFETAVPVFELKDSLSFFQNMKSPHAWTGRFRGSPTKWEGSDGEVVLHALLSAENNPIKRVYDKKKLKYKPKLLQTERGSVSVPDDREEVSHEDIEVATVTDHTRIQALLLDLGAQMGFDVWVARNDKGKEIDGKRLSEFLRMKDKLPLQFDDATNRTIELIDVLWLKGNAIVAAFEVESTTSIYSGILRMSDLLSMQPNINIPLYLVAPDARRDKVIEEVNRPTFSTLHPPLYEVCKYISFTTLQKRIEGVSDIIQFLKPEFIDEIAEPCTEI